MLIKPIKFDLNKYRLYEKLKAKQGDTESRFLLFQLLDGSLPFNLENRSVRAYMIKPDGKEVFNDLIINDRVKGYCTLELTNQVLAAPGIVKLELMVTEGTKKLTSSVFELEVDKSINSEKSIVSTNEFGALLKGLASLNEYDNYKNEIAEARDGEKNLLTKVKKIDEQLETNVKQLNTKIDEVANTGTTVEVLTRVTQEELDKKISNGELANMTIEDGTITENKLHSNFLDKFMGESNPVIVSEMAYGDRTTALSANTYFGINKPINGNRIVKLSIHGRSEGIVNIAIFELLSDTQINVTSIKSFNVVVGRNDFDVNIPLNNNKDNYIAIEGVSSYTMDTNGYTFSQISKSNMQLGTVTAKFGTSNPMFIGLGVEVSKGGTREPMTDILKRDVDKNTNDISTNTDDINELKNDIDYLKNDIDYLKNNSASEKIKFDMVKSEEFKVNNSDWVYDNCTPSSDGLNLIGASESYMNKYNLYFDDSKQRVTFKLGDITSVLGIGAKSNATTFTSYIADFATSKLKMFIHGTKSDLSNSVRMATSKDIDIPIIFDDMYTMIMTRESGLHTFELKHLKTNKSVALTFRTDLNKVNGSYYNLRSGSPSVIQLQGNTTVIKYDYLIGNFKDCECLFLGDSITEGLQTSKETRWCELLNKGYFQGKSIISGISGTNSGFVLMRLNELITLGLKPKNVVVSIGTNDILSETGLNNWKSNIVNIYNKIVELEATPIIAVPPVYNGGLYPQLAQFILEKGWNTLRFDIATSQNGDGITQITNLFVDGVHPNVDGGLTMYNQAINDLEYIF